MRVSKAYLIFMGVGLTGCVLPNNLDSNTLMGNSSGSTQPTLPTSPSPSPSPSSLVPNTVNLNFPRTISSTVNLTDGRVLVFGDYRSVNQNNQYAPALAPPEIFNPHLKKFVVASPMNAPRDFGSTTILTDGRVLISGGEKGYPLPLSLSSAEVFDPTTNRFSSIGSMSIQRAGHTTTLLQDGTVLITGGSYWDNTSSKQIVLNTAEIFDPIQHKFYLIQGSMMDARCGHSATLLPDGKVLIAGGANQNTNNLNTTEIFDPVSKTFKSYAHLNVGRYDHGAVLLTSNSVLVFGGSQCLSECNPISSAEILTVEQDGSGSFRLLSPMNYARDMMAFAILPNGRVLVTGGSTQGNGEGLQNTTELYNPTTEKFELGPTFTIPRKSHAVTVLSDGTVMLIGGAEYNEYVGQSEFLNLQ